MIMSVGGNITNVSIDGTNFTTTDGSTVEFSLGGVKRETKTNANGTTREIVTIQLPFAKGVEIAVESDDTLAALNRINNDVGTEKAVSITLSDGSVISGSGNINGEIVLDSQEASIKIDIMGEGKWKRQNK
jgi:hypothetical protein